MSDSLIEQVKRLAEAASAADAANRTKEQHRNACVKYASACAQVNFPALLAHMQAQQAVCDAARELRQLGPRPGGSLCASIAAVEAAIVALDAALENLENTDGK